MPMNPYIFPLSWTSSPFTQTPKVRKLPLLFSEWLVEGCFPQNYSQEEFLNFFSEHHAFVLRGTRQELINLLVENFSSYDFMLSGTEFLIELPRFQPSKSLRKLIRRGQKKYFFKEITYELPRYQSQIRNLLRLKEKEWKQPLKNLFLTHFEFPIRTFVLLSRQEEIAGVLTISPFGNGYWHLEQMLRNPRSRIGAMEFLIYETAQILHKEQAQIFSLGEVPFTRGNSLSLKNKFYCYAGKKLCFAYNSEGLAFFKNKFATHRKPVYLFANFPLDYFTLFKMLLQTDLHKLVWKKSLHKFL